MRASFPAPKFVEILGWTKDSHTYMAAINQQEEPPVVPVSDITITWPEPNKQAKLLPDGDALACETVDGQTVIHLPKLKIFEMLEIL